MFIIDYNDKRPIYEQIADRYQTLILSGVLEPEEKLPSVRALAIELSINPNTIQRAYALLEQKGFIYTVKGRGNFVKKDETLMQRQKNKALMEFDRQVGVCLNLGIQTNELVEHIAATAGKEKL